MGDLQQQIGAYLRRAPFWLELAEGWNGPDSKRWIVNVREEVPDDFSAIIGDHIHNLRAALDLLACEVVRANGKSDKGVHFPFSDGPDTLDGQIKDKKFHRASPEAIALLKRIKPYPKGNDPLRAIHDLDVIDKHQALIPFADTIGAPNPFAPAGTRSRPYSFGPIRDGMSVTAGDELTGARIGQTITGDFTLTFPIIYAYPGGVEAAPLGGQEVIPALISLAENVERVIEAFAALYPG
jgi:hypothetical protein